MGYSPKNIDQPVTAKYGDNLEKITSAHKCILCGWYGLYPVKVKNNSITSPGEPDIFLLKCPDCGYIIITTEDRK